MPKKPVAPKPVRKKHHHHPSRENRLVDLIKELIELLGETIMGKAELTAAIAANTALAAAVTKTDADAVAALGAGGSDLDALTQQVTDNNTALQTANDSLAAAIPPPPPVPNP
jgi:hypothetical protein